MSPVPGREAPAMGGGNGGIDIVIPQEIYQRIALTDPGDDDGCTGGAIGDSANGTPVRTTGSSARGGFVGCNGSCLTNVSQPFT